MQTTNLESSNPALTPTANAGTWHPGTNPTTNRRNLAPSASEKHLTERQREITPKPHQHPPR